MYIPSEQIWMVVVGFLVAFVLAFGIGANDVANTFGSSVGSGVLTLKQACTLATIFEMSGAILLGSKVSSTVRKGIVETTLFETLDNGPATLMAGQVAALGEQLLEPDLELSNQLQQSRAQMRIMYLDVSCHLFPSSCVWYAQYCRCNHGVQFGDFRIPRYQLDGGSKNRKCSLPLSKYGPFSIGSAVVSWFVSPLLSGLVSVSIFVLIHYLVLIKDEPLEPALRLLPGFYGAMVVVNVVTILLGGSEALQFNKIPIYGIFLLGCGGGTITVILVKLFLLPYLRRRILAFEVRPTESNTGDVQNNGTQPNRQVIGFSATSLEMGENTLSVTKRGVLAQPSLPAIGEEEPEGRDSVYDRPAEAKVFWFLQIMTSILGSFAHGGNDVSNAIGPLMGLWIVGVTQDVSSKMANPYWILIYGGVGISVGLWVWGRRVIQTLGEDLTQITPSSGVCIELGSALTVLLASKLGLPVSTTHCQVGSVIFVGRFRSRSNVNWSIFRNIFIAWVVTVPVACAISALLMYLFTFAL
ncbi:solute carrier family 20 (sodium-dependent phosphate transporter) [Paragonimus westermani]|uniref:Phosphate transporter n=1 Tax=Paragonimus westermani TaxID=34504 RepID=A0A5J4NJT8_9TREM|nr:solute carrier family 20 (sodium-dependent phosphate transporter) [Paragonimus westermani]